MLIRFLFLRTFEDSVKIETACPWWHLVAQVSYSRSHYRLRYLRLAESKENLLELHINNLNWSKRSLALLVWTSKLNISYILKWKSTCLSWSKYPKFISGSCVRELVHLLRESHMHKNGRGNFWLPKNYDQRFQMKTEWSP